MKTESQQLSKTLKTGRVLLQPGEEVGEHSTHQREEVLIILKGQALLKKEDKEILLNQGETHYIGENIKHNVINKSNNNLEYIYIVNLFSKV